MCIRDRVHTDKVDLTIIVLILFIFIFYINISNTESLTFCFRVVEEIMNNEFIAVSTKEGIKHARHVGLHEGDCSMFPCNKGDIDRL